MENIKNAMDKLVCRLDKKQRLIEIIQKGYKTTIRFLGDDKVEVINTDEKSA